MLTSRPLGYRDNPVSGVTTLAVCPYNREQVQQFVSNWYLALDDWLRAEEEIRQAEDAAIDEASEESFPASDAPAY